MRDMETLYRDLEIQAEDIERLRECIFMVGLDRLADNLGEIAKDIRRDVAALRAAKPARGRRPPKLVVNNAKH